MKTKLLSLIISLFACSLLVAQEQPIQKVDVNGVYLIPDKMPEYPGGVPAMMKFLSSNVKYPVEAQKNAISGRVIVQFVVMEDGTLSQAKVIRGVDPLLDEEALRVVKEMTKWTPGIVDGKTVKVKFTVPIMFSLQKNSSKNVPFKLVIPNGQEIMNKRMQGVWQTCMVESVEKGYRLSLGPLLKFISVDNTFMNIIIDTNKMGSVILVQGEYELKSDSIYVENITKSVYSVFPAGVENEISVERLHDNLIKLTFKIPGREEPGVEYWYRIPSPDIKIMAD